MYKLSLLLLTFFSMSLMTFVFGQGIVRQEINVPKADSGAITIDGQMNEAAWQNAAHVDLVTSSGYNIWANKYYRPNETEPEYNELYARLLWSQDTLYIFVHENMFVNDSTGLFWHGKWSGDQLFLGISNRLGLDMQGYYDGNVYAAPDGPYHFTIYDSSVTLNGGDSTSIPPNWRQESEDSLKYYFDPSKIARWATFIDTVNGIWNVEMAVYDPNANAGSYSAFNMGGSTGSRQTFEQYGDAFQYYTWQPNVPNNPYQSNWPNDPGYYSLVTSKYWAILHFMPGANDIVRQTVNVPMADSASITLDGQMNEPEWQNAAHVDLVTSNGYNIWANKYYRPNETEPEYNELYARLLWSQDTLYIFAHENMFVNDSTGLFWHGKWSGDQLFLGISDRLGLDMQGYYDGNVYAAPDGPYHFTVLGPDVTLNGGDSTGTPPQWRYDADDSLKKVFDPSKFARWATFIDTVNGIWNIEMAVYNPAVNYQGAIGFNMGGSTGSRQTFEQYGDAFQYYTWQPNVPNNPYVGNWPNDPGYYSLVTSKYWALLNFQNTKAVGISSKDLKNGIPDKFSLEQNYPNPFNPSTTIRFDLTKQSNVSLKIYNVVGQVVSTLINNQTFNAGYHSIQWNANSFASGVYFYRLEANGIAAAKKMIFLK
ncbi:MAG: T9SS type A sorting domain-containing protein [Ignavibacteriaceae bacterium]